MFRLAVRRAASSCSVSSGSRRLSSAAPAAKPLVAGPGLQVSGAIAAFGLVGLLVLGSGSQAEAAKAHVAEAVATPVVETVEVVKPQVTENVTVVLGVAEDTIAALEARLRAVEGQVLRMVASDKNQAFVFIKPHAVNENVQKLVSKGFEDAGIKITDQGSLTHDVIDAKGLIDNHYQAIAKRAAVQPAKDQNVSAKGKELFKQTFGEDWDEVVKQGRALNAKEACAKWGLNGDQMEEKWAKIDKKTNLVKFGGGHYAGKIEDVYVINGFYMAMRGKYCEAPAKIHYFLVEWDPKKLSWEDFRGKVLGGTDPSKAAEGSLRRAIFDKWQELGLSAKPDTGDNGVHASASPFEASAERVNWVGASLETDTFGKAALSLGIPKEKLAEWMTDAQVSLGGKKGSIFDMLEDQNTDENLELLAQVLAAKN